MAETTKIEWADATWNPLRAITADGKKGWHCEHVSEGCRNCYAETFNVKRLGTGLPFKPGHRGDVQHVLDENLLLAPLRRRKPTRWFLSSMTDVFGAWVPDDHLDRIFAVMALAPQHTFMVLTKRPERMRAYLTRMKTMWEDAGDPFDDRIGTLLVELAGSPCAISMWEDQFVLPNVWLGTSVEDQRAADERIPHLLATPAAVRFLICEPLLGPVDLTAVKPGAAEIDSLSGYRGNGMYGDYGTKLDWIIAGGESGPGARPMRPDWARSLRDQCAAAGVAFHFKQWGEWLPGEIFHPESKKGAGVVYWQDGQEEYNGEHIDFTTTTIGHHTPDGCAKAAFERQQAASQGWIDGVGASRASLFCRRAACRVAGHCKGDDQSWLTVARKRGKARAGRLLDGRTHDEFPKGQANG